MFGLSIAVDAAEPVVTSVLVRFYDDNKAAANDVLSPAAMSELASTLGVSARSVGRSADGAHRIALDVPLALSSAREALNRVRATGAVIYAEIEDRSATASTSRLASAVVSTQRLIVKVRSDKSESGDAIARVLRRGGTSNSMRLERRGSGGTHVVALARATSQADARAVANAMAQDPDVEYVEPERRAFPQALAPDDPLYSDQWNLTDPVGGIQAPTAWAISTGSSAVPIAVIDSGILPHPDLAGRFVAGYDFVSDPRFSNDGDGRDADATDPGDWLTAAEIGAPASPFAGCATTYSTWHGTQVAGVIAASANNHYGITGINWQSPIVPVRVMGKCGAGTSDLADAIRWAAGVAVPGVPANRYPAKVMNLSLSGEGPCGPTLQSAVNDAIAAGSTIVAAAGNDGEDVTNHFPANCNGVIAVAGSMRNGARSAYSNFGTRIALAAPSGGTGGNIMTTRNDGLTVPVGFSYGMNVGTSFSAPHVAAVASLLLSIDPALTPAQILSVLQRSARVPPVDAVQPCTPVTCGAGLLDAGSAATMIVRDSASAGSSTPVVSAPGTVDPITGSAPTIDADFNADARTEARETNAASARTRPAMR